MDDNEASLDSVSRDNPNPVINDDLEVRTDRTPSISRTRGTLYYRKRRPFSKYKQHFVVLDEEKFQMSFYKSEEDHDRLATCKLSVDLRFLDHVLPSRSGLMNRRCGFKLFRRAGLSTLSLAADTEEERAKWINTFDGIVSQVKSSLERESSTKSQSLPASTNLKDEKDYESDNSKTSSVPDDVQIKPKRASRIGFQVDSNQISSIKLRRVSSDAKSTSPEPVIPEGRESQTSFGVTLKKVDIEEIKRRKSKENTEEVTELKSKFSSLSRPRSRSPNIPLTDKLKSSKGDDSVLDSPKKMTMTSSLPRSEGRKKPQASNIPLSDSVKSVIKHTQESSNSTETLTLENSQTIGLKRQGSRICHATTTEIQVFQCGELESVKLEDEERVTAMEPLRYQRSESVHSHVSDKTMIVNLDEESSCEAFMKEEPEVNSKVKKSFYEAELEDKKRTSSKSSSSNSDSYAEDDKVQANPVVPFVTEVINDLKEDRNTESAIQSPNSKEILRNSSTSSITSSSDETCSDEQAAELIGTEISHTIITDTLNGYNEKNAEECINTKDMSKVEEEMDELSKSEHQNSISDKRFSNIECQKDAEGTEAHENHHISTPSKISCQISVSDENDQTIAVEPSSPVEIRRKFDLSYASVYSNSDSKRPSNMSMMSSESDDPLPRHNFLGKNERASLNFPMYSGQFSIEEEDFHKLPKPQKRQSLIHFQSNNSVESTTARISYIEVEELDRLKMISEDESPLQTPTSMSPLGRLIDPPLIGDNTQESSEENIEIIGTPVEISEIIQETSDEPLYNSVDLEDVRQHSQDNLEADQEEIEEPSRGSLININIEEVSAKSSSSDSSSEEETDTFPSHEGIEYRMKNLSLKEEEILRTSGITGLKEYLAGLDSSDKVNDQKVGVNRLGSSVAVEKLRKELQ